MPIIYARERKSQDWGDKLPLEVRKTHWVRYFVSGGSCTDLQMILLAQDGLVAVSVKTRKRRQHQFPCKLETYSCLLPKTGFWK